MPKTIQSALASAVKLLQESSIDTPILDARIILQHCLDITHEAIISRPDVIIDTSLFDQLIKRRMKREPVAQIIGIREFYGYDFKVTRDTLCPRPDSETIIDTALAYFQDKEQKIDILDMGTGTGCLLLTLLKHYKNASGVGIDISEEALKIAKENANNLGVTRSEFIISDWVSNIKDRQFDLIISNPPYIKDEEILTLDPEVRDYEPFGALSGGEDGLECYHIIAKSISALMKKNSIIILEYGINQEQDIISIFAKENFTTIEIKKDLSGINRVLVFRLA